MLPSTSGRGPGGPRRALVHALALLLVTIAFLLPILPIEAPPRRSDSSARDQARSAAVSTVPITHGTGVGGQLLPRESGVALAAGPTGQPITQSTTARPAAVQVTSATTFYDVEGTDIRTLLASLRQRGPSDGQGTWAASTSWVFRWSYRPIFDAACRVQSAHVNLELAYTYPQWGAAANAAPPVANAWQGYLARVELHEHGHRDIAEAAANDLAHALEALPGRSSCDALADAAQATAADLLARHAQEQAAYDLETGHGAAQGAVLRE